MTQEPKKRIGDYEILDELGAGGMGKVYRVRNVITDRVEAMKILLPDLVGRQELADRFLREIKVLASLNHPNIAGLRTAQTFDNQLVMIMEYVEGTTVAQRLQEGKLSVEDAVNYICQALAALSYAHQQQVIHRDIKPSNMILTKEGIVKLMDFGIAYAGNDHSLTTTGTTLGSLNYMSPEQVKGEPTDARSDLYSMGISLYEMVTGRTPFHADSNYSLMAAHVKEPPRPPIELVPGLPAALNEIILMAIAKDPRQRFQNADAMRNALLEGASSGWSIAPTTTGAVAGHSQVKAPVAPAASAQPSRHKVAAASAAQPTAPGPVVAQQSGSRGLYMGIGAVLAIAVLIAAGVYFKSRAERGPQTEATPAAVEPAKAQSGAGAEQAQPPANAPTAGQDAAKAASDAAAAQAAAEAKAAAEAAEKARQVELDELEKQIDGLASRVEAVDGSVETLRRQQRAAGYDLRGDMVAKQASMKNNLVKAQRALESGDVERAKKFAAQAENDVRQLEKFMGR